MVFTSLAFLIFFPVVVALYFLLPHRFRWLLLLIASYYFYMAWKPAYALLLLFSSVSFYLAALGVGKYESGWQRKGIFALGMTINLGMLFLFKYYNFFEAQWNNSAVWLGVGLKLPMLDILLPMGISFYTFQGISYLVDVYRRDMQPERHLGILLLYKAFFPQLVAGPIERGTHFIPQLRTLLGPAKEYRVRFEYHRVVSGLRLMLLGFFKKIVLADNFALIVNPVYENPGDYSSVSALVATVAFAFQIFFDFSAYTDIARGCARVLGFELIENFNRPYFATSIPDFWKRWHISLSSWFRDYLYIPLGGNRVATWRWLANLWVVFLLCGFWHGANWTFVIWGALHGFYYLLTYLLTPPARWLATQTILARFPRLCRGFLIAITFALVCWAWVVFRATSLEQAFIIWRNIIDVPAVTATFLHAVLFEGVSFAPLQVLGLDWLIYPSGKLSLLPTYLTILTAIYLVLSNAIRRRSRDSIIDISTWPPVLRWGSYFFGLVGILLLGRFGATQFIYFQF